MFFILYKFLKIIRTYAKMFYNQLLSQRKLFNKNNLKRSYSCSPNIKQIIDGHNKTILTQNTPPEEKTLPKPCNCREPDKCPLKGQCLVKVPSHYHHC